MVDVSLWPAAAVGCVWICRLALVDAVKAYRERTLVAQAIEAAKAAVVEAHQAKEGVTELRAELRQVSTVILEGRR
jgi:hypothetical protein